MTTLLYESRYSIHTRPKYFGYQNIEHTSIFLPHRPQFRLYRLVGYVVFHKHIFVDGHDNSEPKQFPKSKVEIGISLESQSLIY